MSSGTPPAVAAPKATDDTDAKSPFKYVKLVGESYKGIDQVTGEFLNLIEGDVARVSDAKAAQLAKDFPKDFKASTKSEFEKSNEDRSRRSKALEEKVRAREKKQAVSERERAKDEDDEDGDES